ncbi:MAG: TPM domain-containing protein [Treponema sp.]|nr:TPM domain-containing protein [Treponema sp.]
MKKHIILFSLFFILLTSASWSLPSLVQDDYGLLSNSELSDLQDKAGQLSSQYNCGIYIVVVKNMDDFAYDYEIYNDAFGIEAFAQYYFFNNLKGTGSSGDGILLVMSMKGRDYDIMAHGDFGNYAFTDYGKSKLADSFLDYFADGDWYRGFSSYLNKTGRFLEAAAQGQPVDINSPRLKEHNQPLSLAAGLIFGFIVALLSCLVMKSGMKSVHTARIASNFITQNGISIPIQKDSFTHNTVIRTPIQTSSGGGGGTRINSSGSSHHSGKF